MRFTLCSLRRAASAFSSVVFFGSAVLACGSPADVPPAPPPPAERDAGRTSPDAGHPHAHRDAAPDRTAEDVAPSAACLAFQQKLASGLASAWKGSGSPGAVLAVTTPECGRWVGASGTSSPGDALAATDVLRIGSITKTFVATAALELVSTGKLGLDDALDRWVSGFPNGAGITVRELLNHTSGIFDYTMDASFGETEGKSPGTVWTPEELVAFAAANPPVFAPGTSWGYSNTDYILLGLVLEKVTSSSAGAVLHTEAIAKAGLKLTTLAGYEPVLGILAHGFAVGGTDVTNLYDPSYAWTAGAMVSSAGDLADWAVALYGGDVLTPSALSSMLETVPTGMSGVRYGLGVFVWDASIVGGTEGWGHPGDIDGYHSQMLYLPAKKTAIIGMVNSDAGDPNAITVAALDVLLPQ